MADGLALLAPMMSLPICRQPGSNRAYSRPKLQPGTTPGPPTKAAPMLLICECHLGRDGEDGKDPQCYRINWAVLLADFDQVRIRGQLTMTITSNC